jgi:transposase
MKPSKKELSLFINNRKEAAGHFKVSERTIIRWLQSYGLYFPKVNYGCKKISKEDSEEIREKHRAGRGMKFLAEDYKVTVSTVSRIIHHITHRKNTCADVRVIYNP